LVVSSVSKFKRKATRLGQDANTGEKRTGKVAEKEMEREKENDKDKRRSPFFLF